MEQGRRATGRDLPGGTERAPATTCRTPAVNRRLAATSGSATRVSEERDGGPAFPRSAHEGRELGNLHREQEGMSLRAYIATEAMAALIVANSRRDGPHMDADEITYASVGYAEGLLKQLKESA